MTATAPHLEIHRRREHLDGVDNRRLKAAVQSGAWRKVTAGVYVSAKEWDALHPHQRHLVLVQEVTLRMLRPAVLSHAAAAAVWGIDLLGPWPRAVDVRTARASGGRSSGAILRRALGIDDVLLEPWGPRHFVTTPAQTALDLARSLPFTKGVAAVDQALWGRRAGGPLTTAAEIVELLEASLGTRGDARARRVLAASTHLADNVRESECRLLIAQLGFPTPRLQERRVLASGRVVFGDFYFAENDHWAELDGRGKYVDPEYTHGLDAAEIVIDEKNRENEIRREVRGFSRWETRDIRPRRLYDILTRDGLPSRLPRP